MPEERIYTIPLREAFKVSRNRRAKRAAKIVREFLQRHMKSENVKIGRSINEEIWKRSIEHPPRRIRIHAIKAEDGYVYSELIGIDIRLPTKEEIEKRKKKVEEKKKKIKEERKERKKKTEAEKIKEEKEKAEKGREEKKVETKEVKEESTGEEKKESQKSKAEEKK